MTHSDLRSWLSFALSILYLLVVVTPIIATTILIAQEYEATLSQPLYLFYLSTVTIVAVPATTVTSTITANAAANITTLTNIEITQEYKVSLLLPPLLLLSLLQIDSVIKAEIDNGDRNLFSKNSSNNK